MHRKDFYKDTSSKKERANPQLLQASRKKRIAAGAGMEVSELNKLLKMHRQMADMMKKMGKGSMLKQAMKGMFGKGGGLPAGMDPSQMDPKAMEAAAKQWAWVVQSCPVWAAVWDCPQVCLVSGKRNRSPIYVHQCTYIAVREPNPARTRGAGPRTRDRVFAG